MIFEELIKLYSDQPIRAVYITIGLLAIFSLLCWVSYIDIKKQSIKFKYMLIASASTIIVPFIGSFFCGCKLLKWFLLASIILWFFLLFLNIKFNKNKFVGKADIDLLSALFSETVMYSLWILYTTQQYPGIRITYVWYSFFLYLLVGAIVYVAFYIVIFIYKKIRHKTGILLLIKTTRVPAIPMLIPISVMVPYILMIY